MEEPNNTLDHQHRKKKTTIKIGARSPIGGAVLLLGGALATGAFVFAFIRKRGWGSGKEKDRRLQKKNPPQELGEQDELDGRNQGEDSVVLDKSTSVEKHHPRIGETKMIEPEDSIDSFKQVVKKVRFEINGGHGIIPKVLENGIVCDSPVIVDEEVFVSQGEKLPEELDTVSEGITKFQLIKNNEPKIIMTGANEPEPNEREPEVTIVDDTIALGDQICSLEAENNLNEQENDSAEDKNEVVIEKIEVGMAENGKEHLSMDPKQEADSVPLLDTPTPTPTIVEYEVVNGNEEEGDLATKIVEVIQADEIVDRSHGDGMGCADDELVEKQEKQSDQKPVDDVAVLESCAGEAACGCNPQNDVQILTPEKEINCEDMEENAVVESHVSCEAENEEDCDAIKEVVAENREVNEDVGLDRNSGEEVVEAVKENGTSEEQVKEIDNDTVMANHNVIMPMNNNNNLDSNNEVEECSEETSATQALKALILQEAECRVQEDATAAMKENENGSSFRTNVVEIEECNSKTKYVVNFAKLKGRSVVITVLSVLSSASCSRSFGFLLVKLCAILFLTMALSKIHG